jgi:hypothetical protein
MDTRKPSEVSTKVLMNGTLPLEHNLSIEIKD